MSQKREKKRKGEDLFLAGIAGSSQEIVQRYGDAVKQHYVAYSGVDNEIGKTLVKGLKQISEENINPDYRYQNIHQQAGFTAEVKDVAKSNAEYIIKGDTHRKIRTDDLGMVNDPYRDTVILDGNGNIVEGSGTQIKFLGASENDPKGIGDAARALNKLQSKNFEKYLEQDVKIAVPSDQFDKINQEICNQQEALTRQLENQKNAGNTEQVKRLQEKINKLDKIKANLRKSFVSSKEAVFARLHPKLSTAIDAVKVAHKAGVQTAGYSALIGGSVSLVNNMVALFKEDMEVDEAGVNIAKDTAKTAAVGYGTGFAGSVIKGAMQNSGSQYMRAVSKTNVAGTIVSATVAAGKTMTSYMKGEIDEVECLEQLGEQGTGMIAASMFSVIGQVVIPIPFVGGMIGSMVGYSLSAATYGVLLEALKEEKLAREERIEIEKACEEYIKMIRAYREEMDTAISEYLTDFMGVFRESFYGIKNALAIGDVDWVIESSNEITQKFGGNVLFSDMDDFEKKMIEGSTFKL